MKKYQKKFVSLLLFIITNHLLWFCLVNRSPYLISRSFHCYCRFRQLNFAIRSLGLFPVLKTSLPMLCCACHHHRPNIHVETVHLQCDWMDPYRNICAKLKKRSHVKLDMSNIWLRNQLSGRISAATPIEGDKAISWWLILR